MDSLHPQYAHFNPCFRCGERPRYGNRSLCKECHTTWKRAYYRRTYSFEKQRARNLRQNYNLPQEEYDAMFLKQFGLCAICGNAETARDRRGRIKPLCVDHDHRTGENRELLCQECNMLVGQIEINPRRYKNLVKYLKKHGT